MKCPFCGETIGKGGSYSKHMKESDKSKGWVGKWFRTAVRRDKCPNSRCPSRN